MADATRHAANAARGGDDDAGLKGKKREGAQHDARQRTRNRADLLAEAVLGQIGLELAIAERNRAQIFAEQLSLPNPALAGLRKLIAVEQRANVARRVASERLRGKQHRKLWCDEVASWRRAEAFEQAMLGLRLGALPQAVVTTTPKPIKLIRELMADTGTVTTRGSTYDNRAHLAPDFFARIIKRYEGTRLGRQELNAEMLDDVEGALWTGELIEAARVAKPPDMERIVVAIDPATTSSEDADETGIVVAGRGVDGDCYVLRDLSCRLSSNGWGNRAINAYREYKADRIVAEVNNGGDLVEDVIRVIDRNVPYKAVHASRGKVVRAEPISALYEQKRVHHVGVFAELETQMCSFVPDHLDGSPDRVDALVWALTELMVDREPQPNIRFPDVFRHTGRPRSNY